MPWTTLTERFASLPLILAGPILRRTEPHAVTVWLALKDAQTVTLRIYARNAQGELVQRLEGTRQTVRLGNHLHLVAVTAHAVHAGEHLSWGELYYYNVFFQADTSPDSSALQAPAHLDTAGILTHDPSSADPLHRLRYPGHPLPSFVLPAEEVNQLKILHGSCRKPHGFGKEMLSAVDVMIEDTTDNPRERPQQLFLTGDQIYGDDGATSLLFALIDAGTVLFEGNREEVLPLVQLPARLLAPGTRTEVVRDQAMLTTSAPQSHQLSFAEYASMYLFAWSDVLWPDEVPPIEVLWNMYPQARPRPTLVKREEASYVEQCERLSAFRSTLPQVRRALANIEGRGVLPQAEQALHWHYTFVGARYQLIVLDTRTQRLYRSPSAFPGLLNPAAMERQISAVGRADAEVTILVSAGPVLGVSFIEALQWWSRLFIKNNYAYDREAWNLERGSFELLLRTLSALQRVVVLSGDVHYAFGASLQYWDLRRSSSAKIVNYTSSPLRNEGSSTQMAMLAVGYPYLVRLFKYTTMEAVEFFAWETPDEKRALLHKLFTLLCARIFHFWWVVPRLIEVRSSPTEIVLPAKGWPKGVFDDLPPDRSYRLRYLPDTMRLGATPHTDGEQEQFFAGSLARRGIGLRPLALGVVTFVQAGLEKIRRRLARRIGAAEQASQRLPRGTHGLLHGSIKGAELVERHLEKRKNRLKQALFQREQWLSQWKTGAHIVGYANIGEIGFHWTPEVKEVFQRLWWWHPNTPSRPIQATEYRETLELPPLDAVPPLP